MTTRTKKVIFFLSIVLVLLFIVLVLLSRRSPSGEEGEQGFRRFFNFGTRTTQTGTGNEVVGEFTQDGINPLTGAPYTDEELQRLRQEQERLNRERSTMFRGQQPLSAFDPLTDDSSFTGTGSFDSSSPQTSTPTPQPIRPRPPQTPQGPLCSDVELYINFTDEELREIARLQQRFDAIAGNIVSDQDVQEEENNYSAFLLRKERFQELGEMCTDTMALLSNNTMASLRVPTPFWNDTGSSTELRSSPSFLGPRLTQTTGQADLAACVSEGTSITSCLLRKTFNYRISTIDPSFEINISSDDSGIPFNWFEIFYRIYIW